MDVESLKETLKRELPGWLREDPDFRAYILEMTRREYAGRLETEDRFYTLLNELRRDREEQTRKWEAQKAEQDRKWEEQKADQARDREEQTRKWEAQKAEQDRKWEEENAQMGGAEGRTETATGRRKRANGKRRRPSRKRAKWEEQKAERDRDREEEARKWEAQKAEQNRKWEEQKAERDRDREEQAREWEESGRRFDRMHEEIMAQAKKFERSIGALGARWGTQSEKAFRDALAGILEENFDVRVLNVTEYDDTGEVFGRPEQVELDVIVKNGLLLICELKSSIDKAGMYIFERKARFYEKLHQRTANRLIVISPMIDARARKVAERLGIETFGDSIEVEAL